MNASTCFRYRPLRPAANRRFLRAGRVARRLAGLLLLVATTSCTSYRDASLFQITSGQPRSFRVVLVDRQTSIDVERGRVENDTLYAEMRGSTRGAANWTAAIPLEEVHRFQVKEVSDAKTIGLFSLLFFLFFPWN
jgi:microcystin degradation protein MlrC